MKVPSSACTKPILTTFYRGSIKSILTSCITPKHPTAEPFCADHWAALDLACRKLTLLIASISAPASCGGPPPSLAWTVYPPPISRRFCYIRRRSARLCNSWLLHTLHYITLHNTTPCSACNTTSSLFIAAGRVNVYICIYILCILLTYCSTCTVCYICICIYLYMPHLHKTVYTEGALFCIVFLLYS